MFTGIIEVCGSVVGWSSSARGSKQLVVETPSDFFTLNNIGDSICVDGCCLTLVEKQSASRGMFELSPETLSRTVEPSMGALVHMEHSLRLGDQVGGHFVFGHVDGVATIEEVSDSGGGYEVGFALPEQVEPRYVVPKGSVAIGGVSLTVSGVKGRSFWVQLIPATCAATRLSPQRSLAVGVKFNFEIDYLARYVFGSR